ncbi:MAG: acyl carrier protein [Planctomycetes bacterium]|nr:acyl carrier protein [Planctomycetota bacterium]
MGADDIHERIRAGLFHSILAGVSVEIDPETSLIDAGIIDSYTVLQISAFLNEEFGVAVPPEEHRPENFASIRAIAALCERLGPVR